MDHVCVPYPPELSPHPHHVFRISILSQMCRLKIESWVGISAEFFFTGSASNINQSSIINGSDVEQSWMGFKGVPP